MTDLHPLLLDRLARLKPGSTMCPGQLARDCGTTLAAARADLLTLARDRKIILSQRGKSVSPSSLRGPFRVRLSDATK